jgi:hypothetical protein
VSHRIYLPFSNVPHHTNGRVHTLAALLLAQIYENILNILETQLLIKPAPSGGRFQPRRQFFSISDLQPFIAEEPAHTSALKFWSRD